MSNTTYGSNTADIDALETTVRRQAAAAQSEGDEAPKRREMSLEEMEETVRPQNIDLSEVPDGNEPWVKGTWLCECIKMEYFAERMVTNDKGEEEKRFKHMFLTWRALHGPNVNRTVRDRIMLDGNVEKALQRFKVVGKACDLIQEYMEGGKKKSVYHGPHAMFEGKIAWVTVEPKTTTYTQGKNAGKTFTNDEVTFAGYQHRDSKPIPPELSGEEPTPEVQADPYVEAPAQIPAEVPAAASPPASEASAAPPQDDAPKAAASGSKAPW